MSEDAEVAVLQEKVRAMEGTLAELHKVPHQLAAIDLKMIQVVETVNITRQELKDHMDQELNERAEVSKARHAMWGAIAVGALSAAGGLANAIVQGAAQGWFAK
jgi:hypothetical protein